ncbi:hypothetical protein [Streptomyces thermodiastaticus]|uniref:hypothetical protein n=1 Tax=Streptomyces thermodiastaticus TaxID=44061 RepID=UPI001679676A|nr:hypothetical protein [Streptomyces thermodiastaticus]MCE7550902.1 hypothetical protein [Streptomyces thermodiastaticus]GHF73939.1 hypothetical protein GCM10018787_23300 [Streptomyces thermodiastaticus]
MALDPLATVADLAARGLTVAASEQQVAATYLDVASTTVREAAGCPISQTTSTITLDGEASQWLALPGPPVTEVTSVVLDGKTVTDWRLRSGRLWRACGWSDRCEPSEVEVTYTHGLPTVPSDIVDLVCRLAAAALIAYRAGGATGENLGSRPLIQERIGDWSGTYSYSPLMSEQELPDYERARLRARFGGGVAVVRSR